jgi:hypothetical protein
MKICPVVPEICHGQVHVPKKERQKERKENNNNNNKKRSKNNKSHKCCLGDLITIKHNIFFDVGVLHFRHLFIIFVCLHRIVNYLFPVWHPVGTIGYFFRRLYIYIKIQAFSYILILVQFGLTPKNMIFPTIMIDFKQKYIKQNILRFKKVHFVPKITFLTISTKFWDNNVS